MVSDASNNSPDGLTHLMPVTYELTCPSSAPSRASFVWQHAAEPSVRLPISMFSMNCSFFLRRTAAASTSCTPACAVRVFLAVSIFRILLKPSMLTMVPLDEAHGVSEWLLPIARTGPG